MLSPVANRALSHLHNAPAPPVRCDRPRSRGCTKGVFAKQTQTRSGGEKHKRVRRIDLRSGSPLIPSRLAAQPDPPPFWAALAPSPHLALAYQLTQEIILGVR